MATTSLPEILDRALLMDITGDDTNYLHSDDDFPGGVWPEGETIAMADVPARIRPYLEALVEESLACPDCDGEGCEDCVNGKVALEVKVTRLNVPGVFELSVHDPGCPFNPSGQDYFFHQDGKFLGYTES